MDRRRKQHVNITAARKAEFPGFIEPCHPSVANKIPADGEWTHEIKLDGYRAQGHINDGKIALFTRRGYDWTQRFSSIAKDLQTLHAKTAILDGEIIVPDARGVANFHRLQDDLAKGRTDRLTYCVFDAMYLDGFDLRDAPLRERRRALRELIGTGTPHLLFSDSINADDSALLERAREIGLEGIVSKRLDARYRSGRQDAWLKIKCHTSDSFPIVAFVEKLGARPRRVASLYLGRYEGEKLLYAGKAQTGYTTEDLHELRERLDRYIIDKSPLSVPVKKPKATWVKPVMQAEIQYSAFTADGLLRAPVYKGLRDDLSPIADKLPAPTWRPARYTHSSGVPRENILQLLPDAVPPTSEALTAYWQLIHERALPYLARRPLKLVRHVRGTTFYHKGPLPPVPPGVRQLTVKKREGGEGTRLWVDDLKGLLGLTQMGVVEVHPWNATVDDIERADTMVFDLDPGEGIEWNFVMDAALTLRELLEQDGFESWPKLTGGKGVHLMVPLREPMTHDLAHRRSKAIADRLAQTDRNRFTISAALSSRPGRLFIDYLRNGRGTTAVGTYSPRARRGHPIAAPVTWTHIQAGIRPDAFTMERPPTLFRKPRPVRERVSRKQPSLRSSKVAR